MENQSAVLRFRKLIILSASALLLALPLAAQTQHPLSAADRAALSRALDAQDQGHPEVAEPALRDLARRNPSSFEVLESLGVLYAEGNRFDSALPLLKKAATLQPGSAIAQANLGAALLKLNRNPEALHALERASALDPANTHTQSDLAQALMLNHDPRAAAKAFARASAGKFDDPDLIYNWALASFESGDAAQAAALMAKLADAPSSAPDQELLGDIAEQQHDYKNAVEHYKLAVQLDPSEPNLYVLGVELLRHWTFAEAIKIFEYGVSKYPQSRRMEVGLGIAHYSANDYARATPIFSRLLDADPDNAFYADMLGHMCALLPNGSGDCGKLVAFAERHPKNAPAAAYAAASILHSPSGSENLKQVRSLLDQSLAADPRLPEASYLLGMLDQQEGKWAESIPPLQKAIALKPDFAKAHYRLGLAWSHTGKRELAQQEIALEQKYSKQETDDLNARFKKVTTFLITQK